MRRRASFRKVGTKFNVMSTNAYHVNFSSSNLLSSSNISENFLRFFVGYPQGNSIVINKKELSPVCKGSAIVILLVEKSVT